MKKMYLAVTLAIPLATAVLQSCSSQQPESSRSALSGNRAEHDRQAALILADIHSADASYKIAEKSTVNKRGQLVLKLNREATEAEVKPMVTMALKRLIQTYPGPKAAVMVVGPSSKRIATARFAANGEIEFFDPRKAAR
jgi:hypothetical protein